MYAACMNGQINNDRKHTIVLTFSENQKIFVQLFLIWAFLWKFYFLRLDILLKNYI